MVADDQTRRANMVSRHAPVVISSCETPEERREAVERLLELAGTAEERPGIDLDGADRAVEEILALVTQRARL
jgi:hypothetical protein